MYPIAIDRTRTEKIMRPEVALQQPIQVAYGGNSKQRRSKSSGGLAASVRSGRLTLKKQWRRPKILSEELEHIQEFNCVLEANQFNEEAAEGKAPDENVPSTTKVPWVFSYPGYRPTGSRIIESVHFVDLPVHYWFYIFAYSSDVEFILKPFRESDKKTQMDKRVLCLMRRNRVQLILKDLELYKSLPRRVIVIKAPDWDHILSTLADLEVTLPDMMRFASYPLLMDTDTTRFPCTSNLTTIFTRAVPSEVLKL